MNSNEELEKSERAEGSLESVEVNVTEKENLQVEKISEDITADTERKVAAVSQDGTDEDINEMKTTAAETVAKTNDAKEEYYEAKQESEGGKKRELVESFVKKNYEKIAATTRDVYSQLGIDIASEDVKSMVGEILSEALKNPDMVKNLEDSDLIGGETATIITLITPYVETTLEGTGLDSFDDLSGKLSGVYNGMGMEGSHKDKAKEIASVILSNPENDLVYIGKAGVMLENLAEDYEGTKEGMVIKAFAKLLQSRIFQKMISNKFRSWLETRDGEGKATEADLEEFVLSEMN